MIDGAVIHTSATWQMWVATNASVDTSSGTTFDVNGDGFADVLVGGGDGNVATVYLGNATGSGFTQIDIVTPDGPDGFGGSCNGAGTCFGGTVANTGDVNGDGYADFLVASWHTNTGQYGRKRSTSTSGVRRRPRQTGTVRHRASASI